METYVSGNAIRRIYGKPAEQITDRDVIMEIAQNFGEGLRNVVVMHSLAAIIIGGGSIALAIHGEDVL